MSVSVYAINSTLSQVTQEGMQGFLHSVSEALGEALVPVDAKTLAALPFGLVYIASGGSEDRFMEDYFPLMDRTRPCRILTSGDSNSLAASMEILSRLHEEGCEGEILHGSLPFIAERIRILSRAAQAKAALTGLRLGLVGAPSDWLIASSYDPDALHAKLNAEIVPISMDELLQEIAAGGYPESAWTAQLLGLGYDRAEVEKSLQVYGALRRLVDRYQLGAVTVRCFDLLDSVQTTGCLALAILNAEGIYAGCEGDVPSALSMAILGAVSGQPGFMCNPSRIDMQAGNMILAHCSLPLNMPYALNLTTHYESGIGVAIAGSIPEGPCTVFKADGALSRYYVKAGRLTQNLREPCLCRSQIRVELDDFSYFLTNPIHNHHIVCVGDHTAAVEEFFRLLH